jgi:hypothetical protein
MAGRDDAPHTPARFARNPTWAVANLYYSYSSTIFIGQEKVQPLKWLDARRRCHTGGRRLLAAVGYRKATV